MNPAVGLDEMIFRLTQKMVKKVGLTPLQALPPGQTPFIDWTSHLFTAERVQYIIVTNTVSLYGLVLYGRGITDENEFIKSTLSFMKDLMVKDGYEFFYQRLIAPYTARVLFAKATDQRVLGSINELVREAKFYLVERQLSPFDTSCKLNESILSYLGYNSPREVFRQLKTGEGNVSSSNI